MGEYEDRYPEMSGRTSSAERPAPPETRRVVTRLPQQVRDRSITRERPASASAAERPGAGQHAPAEPATPAPAEPPLAELPPVQAPAAQAPSQQQPAAARSPLIEPLPAMAPGSQAPLPGHHRGRGPRGYVRSPERIYEDLCDRLTENPFIDATDITVAVVGSEIGLNGTVANAAMLRETLDVAQAIVGVSAVHNSLQVRPG